MVRRLKYSRSSGRESQVRSAGGARAMSASALSLPLSANKPSSRAGGGAGVLSGVLVLANTLLGAGMLGLPAAIARCGYVAGSIFLVGFAASGALGLLLLSEAADAVGRPSTFNRLANAALPGGALAFDLAIALKCFGVATSYLIVVGDNLPKAMVGFGVASPLLLQRRTWVLVSLGLAAPLAFMRNITALRHTYASRTRRPQARTSTGCPCRCGPSACPCLCSFLTSCFERCTTQVDRGALLCTVHHAHGGPLRVTLWRCCYFSL